MDLFDIYGSRSDDDDENDDVIEGDPQAPDPSPAAPPAPDPQAGSRATAGTSEASETPVGRTSGHLDGATDELPPAVGDPGAGEEVVEEEEFRRLRPYARTGGRTEPEVALGVESLVATSPRPPGRLENLRSEHAYLRRLCATSTSLAEISAYMNLPIGVTRVIVSDAIQAGLVELVSPAVRSERPPLQLMHRVLAGLQRL